MCDLLQQSLIKKNSHVFGDFLMMWIVVTVRHERISEHQIPGYILRQIKYQLSRKNTKKTYQMDNFPFKN